MGLSEGDWVLINGSVARIASISASDDVVLAERLPSGSLVERPRTFAELHWTPLDETGLAVQMALDARTVQVTALQAPADIVVAALLDAGGEATTMDLRDRITPDPVSTDDWERWWGRLQPRLEHDPRIDATRAREKRYRLLRQGETVVQVIGPIATNEVRRGRRLADARQLAEARKIGRRRASRRSEDDQRLIAAELPLAAMTDIDPTDRYMAAELAVWVGEMDEPAARDLVGRDIDRVDLLRIRQAGSRDRALVWALEDLASGAMESMEVLRSAAAAGPPWSEQAVIAASTPLVARAVGEGFLGWAVPGDEDAGLHKYPDDLAIFDNRLARATAALASAEPDVALGIMHGALAALERLPETTGQHTQAWKEALDGIARLAWNARAASKTPVRLDLVGPLRPEAVMALAGTATINDARAADALVAASYLARPREFESVFRYHCQRGGKDPVARGLDLLRQRLQGDPARIIALQLLHWAAERRLEDDLVADVASLAASIAPDDRGARERLDSLTAEQADALLDLRVIERAAWFGRGEWVRFAHRLLGRIEEAYERERTSKQEATILRAEVDRLTQALAIRTEALAETRSAAGADQRGEGRRQGAVALRPVMAALADSYEARSLPALQDRLVGALRRVGIVSIGTIGDTQVFDPERHEWVGEGVPADEVELISPGFMQEGDDEDAVVLVPARVVGPR